MTALDQEQIQRLLNLSPPSKTKEESEFYYADELRSQRLALLHHVAPYSQALLITGVAATGKSAFLRNFIASANESWRIHFMEARSSLASQDFLAQIAERYSVSNTEPDLEAKLVEQFHALRKKGLIPILIIDDAQQLPEACLQTALQLTETADKKHPGLSVILCGRPELAKTLLQPALQPLRERIVHEFQILPFSEADTANFMEQREKSLLEKNPKLVLPSLNARKIHSLTGGLPGLIDDAITEFSGKETKASVLPKLALPRFALSSTSRLLFLGIIVSALLAVFIFRDDINKAVQPAKQVPPRKDATTQEFKLPSQEALPTAPAEDHPTQTQTLSDTPPSSVTAGPMTTTPMAIPPLGPPEEVKHLPIERTTLQVTESKPASPAPAALVNPAPPAREQKTQPKTITPAPTATKAAPRPAAPKSIVTDLLDAAWLLSQPADHYTLQLAALENEADIRTYIRQHHLQGTLATYQTASGLYAITYGIYATRTEARAAAQELSAATRKQSPWVRKIGEIQAIIKKHS